MPKATESELLILDILWGHQPCSVKFVTAELSRRKQQEVKYTTALKLLQLMHEKGLVKRDESARSHLYSAGYPRRRVQRHVLNELAGRIFGGGTVELALQALATGKTDPDELKRLRDYIDKKLQQEDNK